MSTWPAGVDQLQERLEALKSLLLPLPAALTHFEAADEAIRVITALREAIDDAPHADYCGAPSSAGANVSPCRCWKSNVLSRICR